MISKPIPDSELCNLNVDPSDLDYHFNGVAKDWIEAAREGSRLLGLYIGDDVEEDSPFEDLFHSVAAKASASTYELLAKVLGVSAETLSCLQDEEESKLPHGPDALMKWCAEVDCELDFESGVEKK